MAHDHLLQLWGGPWKISGSHAQLPRNATGEIERGIANHANLYMAFISYCSTLRYVILNFLLLFLLSSLLHIFKLQTFPYLIITVENFSF
jgi:hypothetical protein